MEDIVMTYFIILKHKAMTSLLFKTNPSFLKTEFISVWGRDAVIVTIHSLSSIPLACFLQDT